MTFLQAVRQRYGAEPAAAIGGGAGDDNVDEEEMFVVGEASRVTKVYMIGKEKITEKQRYIAMALYKGSCGALILSPCRIKVV